MNLRFIFRELQRDKGLSVVFIICVALSLVSIVAINSSRRDVLSSLKVDSRKLHGGDIIISSNYDFSPPLLYEIDRLKELRKSQVESVVRTWEFYSVARKTDESYAQLCNIKVVESPYPLYGSVLLKSGKRFQDVLVAGSVVVSSSLLERFRLKIGDHISLGDSNLIIVDVIEHESVRPIDFFNFGPRIFVSARDLHSLNLVQQGSRVQYKALLKVQNERDIKSLVGMLRNVIVEEYEQIVTYQSAQNRLERFFTNLFFFLSIISVFTLLLAGIGIQSSMQTLLRKKRQTIAIMKSLGAANSYVYRHFFIYTLILGCFGSVLGVMGGFLIELFHAFIFQWAEGVGGTPQITMYDLLEGMIFGVCIVCIFTYIPLSALQQTKPLLILRNSEEKFHVLKKQYLLLFLSFIMFGLFVAYQLNDLFYGVVLSSGFGVLLLGVTGIVTFIIWVFSKIKSSSFWVKLVFRSISRPMNNSRVVIVTLSCALAVLFTLYFLQENLHDNYVASYPDEAPNLFCLDIQKKQREGFKKIVGENQQLFPVIRARLLSINGKEIQKDRERQRRGDSLAREFNLTYGDSIQSDEKLVEGKTLFGKAAQYDSVIPVSVLDMMADLGNIHLGDLLQFNIQGVVVTTKVMSIRERKKSLIYPFFYFIFPTQALFDAPQTFFAALRVDTEELSLWESRIVQEFPNISTINVTESIKELQGATKKFSQIVTFFSLLSLVAGGLILISSVMATRLSRTEEAVYYKIQGATSWVMARLILYENIVLSVLSSLCGLLIGHIGSWGLCKYIFRIDYQVDFIASFWFVIITATLIGTIGLLFSLPVIRARPATYLQKLGS